MQSISDVRQMATELFVLRSTELEDVPVGTLIAMLKIADDDYFNATDAEVALTDEQYDTIKSFAQRVSPTDLYFTGVGSDVRGGKVKLPYKMGSLNQVYQGDYVKWVDRHKLHNETVVITDKLDGASNLMCFASTGNLQIAYSRGDGERGADITRHSKNIPSVPNSVNYGKPLTVRAETIISKSNFTKIKNNTSLNLRRDYKNPRNMVSGLMNSSEINAGLYEYIDVVAYEIVGSTLSKTEQLRQLRRMGFKTVNHSVHPTNTLDDEVLTDILNDVRSKSDYELDGIVIDVDSHKTRDAINNPDELNPIYAVKFKVADASNEATPTVKEVEWNISKDGYLKPRIVFEPVELMGVTVKHATGFNAQFIKVNNIGPGAVVRITRSGDVIPFVLGVVTPAAEPQMPEEDAVWTETGVDLIVEDVSSNANVKFERLNDFFASIDVPHLGEGNLRVMFDKGFDTPELIIPLTVEDLQNLVGSLSIGKKIYASFREKFTNIPLHKLMGSHSAFGRGVGVRKMRKLEEAFNGDMSPCRNLDAIVAVEGFDRKTAVKIVNGYDAFQNFMQEIDGYVTLAEFTPAIEGKFTGMTFVFTGFRNAALEKQVTDLGGKMGSTVSRKTTYLVTSEPNSTSGKAVKAREVGVTVIGIDELKGLIG